MRKHFKYLAVLCISIFILLSVSLNLMASKKSDSDFPPPPPPFMKDKKQRLKRILFFSNETLQEIGVDEKRRLIIMDKIEEILVNVRKIHKRIMQKHGELRKEFGYIAINKNRAKKLILEITELHYKMRKTIELKKFELMLLLNVEERRKLRRILVQRRKYFWKRIKSKQSKEK